MRDFVVMAMGAAFVYFMLGISIVYGERNADKIDEWIGDFLDWMADEPMYSNTQSYNDIDGIAEVEEHCSYCGETERCNC